MDRWGVKNSTMLRPDKRQVQHNLMLQNQTRTNWWQKSSEEDLAVLVKNTLKASRMLWQWGTQPHSSMHEAMPSLRTRAPFYMEKVRPSLECDVHYGASATRKEMDVLENPVQRGLEQVISERSHICHRITRWFSREEPDITHTPMLSSMQQLPSPVRSLTSNLSLKVFKGWNPSTSPNFLHSPSVNFKAKKKKVITYKLQNFLFWNLFLLRAMYFWEKAGAIFPMTSSRWANETPLSAFCFVGQSDPVTSLSLYVMCTWRDSQIKSEHPKASCTGTSLNTWQVLSLKLCKCINVADWEHQVSAIPCQNAGKNRCPENTFFGSLFLFPPLRALLTREEWGGGCRDVNLGKFYCTQPLSGEAEKMQQKS